MSTIASLISLIDPSAIKPWYEGQQGVNREQIGRQQAQTGLIELARLKQSQASEEEVMAFYREHPELLVGGGSVLGSLGPTGGPPGAQPPPGAITQSPLGGGPAQQIPAYPDASRYAGVSPQGGGPIPPDVMAQTMPTVTPPPGTLTLATIGPQGGMPGPPQGPQNPLLEMARRDPRAALMLQQQMQGQQDRQWKMQEQQLGMGVKVAEFVARELQGVTDQASLDQARERIRQVHPQAAAQVPQMYSKDAVESVQQRGIAIAERATTQLAEAKARNLDMETRMFPELAKRVGMESDGQVPADGGTPTTTAGRGAVPGVENLSPQFQSKAASIADRLGANRDDLLRVMHFETGGDMSPSSRNRAGSGATGLIQFMPETAKALGTTTDALAKMTSEQQLDYVERYLEPYKGKIGTLKDLYMAVLYPQAIGQSEESVLFSPEKTPDAYRQNAALDVDKKGYVTVGDAVAAVKRTTGSTARAAPDDPRIAQLETKIAQRTRDAQIASLMKNDSLSTRLNDDANRLKDERARLLEESRRQQERREEIPRAAEKQTAELEAKQEFERKRQGQPLLPEAKLELLIKLRTHILAEPTHKLYQDVRNGYDNVRIGAASDSAQGDLAIVNGMAKILDPTGTVLSGEARNIEEAQGQLQRWFMTPERFFTGDRISVENRPRFLRLAHALAKEKLTTAQKELEAVYGPITKDAGLQFSQLVPLEDLKPLGQGPNVDKLDQLIAK